MASKPWQLAGQGQLTEFQIRSSLRFPEGMYHGSDEASLGLSRMKRIICSQGQRLAECFEHFDLAVRSLVLVRQAAADCFNQAFLHFFSHSPLLWHIGAVPLEQRTTRDDCMLIIIPGTNQSLSVLVLKQSCLFGCQTSLGDSAQFRFGGAGHVACTYSRSMRTWPGSCNSYLVRVKA